MECGGRAVGEIGEALPVADEASRFRGSAPIGGHDSGRESVGTTVGNRRPLRYYPRLFTAPLYFPLDNGQKIGII